ncbi:MAG TPA: DNA-directed RNA polymerase subunit alpha [Candidatus Paceibacterota bacterium]
MDYNIVLPSFTKVVSEEDTKGVYEITNLYPGYGNTLGNSLRRILLSSIPGAAITKIKINGVSHEFSTLPGVKEDVVKIILNLKQLRFKLYGDEPQVASLDVRGQKDVTGKDVKPPTQLEVINKDHHLFSLTDKNAKLSMEITVERGIGFVSAEELAEDKVAIGDLVLDAIFTPIRRVNFEVENIRVGDRTDYNLLRITVETDGSITPRDAFKTSVSIMKKQIEKMETFDEGNDYSNEKTDEKMVLGEDSIENLKISQRTKNALLDAGIVNTSELALKSADEILSMDGVGEKAVTEIKKALKSSGLSLRE